MTLVAQTRDSGAGQKGAEHLTNALPIAILFLSFVMPFFFYLGGMRLSAYRLYLLFAAIPLVIRWAGGAAGPIRTTDILVILASFWMAASLFIHHGIADQWDFAGILMVETVVPYLTARVLIRDLSSFRALVKWFYIVVAALVPFAFYENVTGKPILLDMFRGAFNVYYNVNQEPRLGLERAQASMPHPILFGVFCAPAFALAWYVLGSPKDSIFKRMRRPFVAGFAVFSSLSSGAFMGVLLQAFLIAWDEILKSVRQRWKIFAIVMGVLYVVLELASNRNAFQIIATEMTFSAGSAWNRIHIFNNAIDDIFRSPILGIGLNDWTRPDWLRSSVDNFWLLVALRYGIPTFFLLSLSVILICWKAIAAPLSGAHARARTGYLIAFLSMVVTAFTVHLWDATYVLFMFLLGAGAWFADVDQTQQEDGREEAGPKSPDPGSRYTRFPSSAKEERP